MADLSRAPTITLPEAQPRAKQPLETSEATPTAERPEMRVKPRKAMTSEQVAQMSLFGHQLFEMGKTEEARVVFEGLVSLEVHEAFPYTMLGTIYLAMDDFDRAMALFEAALRIDRDDLAALVYRGEIHLSQKRVRAAKDDLERALKLGLKDDPFVIRAAKLLQIAQEKSRKHSK